MNANYFFITSVLFWGSNIGEGEWGGRVGGGGGGGGGGSKEKWIGTD